MNLKSIIFQTIKEIFLNKKALFRNLFIPILLAVLFSTYQYRIYEWLGLSLEAESYVDVDILITIAISALVTGCLSVLMAVSTHRIVILGEGSLQYSFGIYISLRLLKFMGWAVLCFMPALLISTVYSLSLFYFIRGFPLELAEVIYKYNGELEKLLTGSVALLTLVAVGLILPGTAVEEKYSIKDAFYLARGHRGSIFVILLSTTICVFSASWLVKSTVTYFYAWQYDFVTAGVIALDYIFWVVEIVVLSTIYKNLK